MKRVTTGAIAALALAASSITLQGSSHREALAVLNEPCADNTDTFAWVSDGTHDKLYLIMDFNPLHEPGQGNQGLRACNVSTFGNDILFPVLVRDAEALGIYAALGVPPASVTALKGPRLDIIDAINLGRPIPVQDGFTGDVITLDAAIDSSFPNGRRMGGGSTPNRNQVNVNTVLISLIVAGDPAAGLAKGTETNDKEYLDRFPFLAPAHQGLLQGHGGINEPPVPDIPDPNNP